MVNQCLHLARARLGAGTVDVLRILFRQSKSAMERKIIMHILLIAVYLSLINRYQAVSSQTRVSRHWIHTRHAKDVVARPQTGSPQHSASMRLRLARADAERS